MEFQEVVKLSVEFARKICSFPIRHLKIMGVTIMRCQYCLGEDDGNGIIVHTPDCIVVKAQEYLKKINRGEPIQLPGDIHPVEIKGTFTDNEERNITQWFCAECGEPQWNTPSGKTCKNGHGGAGSV